MNGQVEGNTESLDIGRFSGFELHLVDKGFAKHQESTHVLKTVITCVSILFVIAGSFAYYFYVTANTNKANWLFQKAVSSLTEKELLSAKEIINLKDSIIIWNEELNKPLDKLVFSDFSDSPIKGTPSNFVPLINGASKKYGIPGSLISAQMWEETRFQENLVYFGRKQGQISDWKQVWNPKRKAYDLYVKYFAKYDTYKVKSAWHFYDGELSVGASQTNLGYGAHDTIRKEDAMNLVRSVDFVGDRWKYFSVLYPKESVFFLAMAYNSAGAAKNGKEYLLGYTKTLVEIKRAKLITQYGKDVVSIARNQKLTEMYQDLFGKFKNKEDIQNTIPVMKLLYVNQTDYHLLIDYKL